MSGLLFIGTSALQAYRQALDTTGHNIANVGTAGYNRQRIDFVSRAGSLLNGHFIGNGVHTAQIERVYDNLLVNQVRANQSVASQLDAYYSGAYQLDGVLANAESGLQPSINSFFAAIQELANDPTSTAARQVVLGEAQTLADRFHAIDSQFNQSRDLTNQRLGAAVDEVNLLAESIARVNADVVASSGGAEGVSSDLLDERDRLIGALSELVDLNVVEQDDGALNIFIGNGQSLVLGTQAATLATQPSALDASRLDITLDLGSGPQIITRQIGGGQIGGLQNFREQVLDPARNRLGLIALGMSAALNDQHHLGLDLNGLPGGDLFSMGSVQVLEPAAIGGAVTASFDSIRNLTGSDYEVVFDGASFIMTRLSDHTTTVLAAGDNIVDGLNINIDPTGAVAGDRYLIQPTRNAAGSIDLLINDPSLLAAAGPLYGHAALDVSGNPANTGDAVIGGLVNQSMTGLPLAGEIQLVYDQAVGGFQVFYPGSVPGTDPADDFIAYDNTDPATIAGITVPGSQFDAIGGISFSLSGIPADGDSFVIANNTTADSDNSNALRLADLQEFAYFIQGDATFSETYAELVSQVGSQARQAEINLNAQEGLLAQSQAAVDARSGVNLDEEAARLIQYQQAYEASAQVISVASTIFETLLAATSR